MGFAGNAISTILKSVAIKSLPSGPQEDTYLKTLAPNGSKAHATQRNHGPLNKHECSVSVQKEFEGNNFSEQIFCKVLF